MDFQKAYDYLVPRLKTELPAYLTYHHLQHTLTVLAAAEEIAHSEKLSEYEIQLIKTAALFHDAGFLTTYKNHEQASCAIARAVLPNYGYAKEEIEAIIKLIMVTELPQLPSNIAEKVMCDADLFYLGTDKYLAIAEDLYEEFNHEGLIRSRKEWEKKQIQFLKSHQYFTKTAMTQYGLRKQQNLVLLTKEKEVVNESHWKQMLHDAVFMMLGVFTAGFALEGFLVPNKFFDGGVTGMSLLIHGVYNVPLSYLIIALNIPLIIAGYFSVSKSFAFKTLICVLLLGICVSFIHYPIITTDKLLISIFGGFFLGLGIGFAMRAGCALDGMEVLAVYTLKRTSFTITEIILAINVIIFGVAAIQFGIETALYSVLTYLAASKTIDYVIEGIEAYTGVTIISGQSEVIKHRLVNELGRGITVYKGERGFLPGKFEVSTEADIIFTVITRLELRRLKNLVYEVDPKAFVFASTIKEASGGIIKRRRAH